MRPPRRPAASRLLGALLGAALVAPLAPAPATAATGSASADPAPAERRAGTRQVDQTRFEGAKAFRAGQLAGTRVARDRVFLGEPVATRGYDGRTYDVGRWTGRWVEPGFGLTQLVASWEARTPGDSWVEVEVRGRGPAGRVTGWDTLGRWAADDRFVQRTTVSGQDDDDTSVDVDTWKVGGTAGMAAWQVRVSLMRRAGASTKAPSFGSVGAMSSRLPTGDVTTSRPGVARGVVLDVPRYSQMIHQGHYPQWGGGGEAWCSPTSTSMVLAYYDALPSPGSYSWVGEGHVDPWVDAAARSTYDHAYDGTGNWPFNTAFAALHTTSPEGGGAFVTRLRSLREAELMIKAGIPVIASISFGSGELSGAPISASNGHLLVIVGFTASGDVVVNDPAARDRTGVRRTYDRGQFEDAWLPTSGGLAYLVTDAEHPLPAPGEHSNW
ncbi:MULTISPECIES: C39 family peptidase [Nocardioides]|uniref:C39 family peptidase n=1 Tax=Nocardioides TaxID=1839 RepID=UPI001A349289|nr:C39 family peptidase [Nocardioides sp. P86]MBJ7528164.1 C39 family peptidase [Nocardioides sp.]MCM3517184.1 C39 family peptidase [Nocardioides sp. P86]